MEYLVVDGVTYMEHDGFRSPCATVPVAREDIEDFYGPLIDDRVRRDLDAGCQVWLVEKSAFHRRIVAPVFTGEPSGVAMSG